MLCLRVNDRLIVTASNGERIEFVNSEDRAVKVGIEAPREVRVIRSEAKPLPDVEAVK
jgi:sRNA-binding carbon storage regulator CsrA